MGKCQSAAHVVGAAEMRRVKAVASAMELTPTVATAAMTATVTTAAVTTAAVASGTRQCDRQKNNCNPSS
jgi:hypothetical protein